LHKLKNHVQNSSQPLELTWSEVSLEQRRLIVIMIALTTSSTQSQCGVCIASYLYLTLIYNPQHDELFNSHLG